MSELKQAASALKAERSFDIDSLEQRQRLGDDLAFTGALQPAKAFRSLFANITESSLNLLPQQALKHVKESWDAVNETYTKILNFKSEEGNQGRQTLINQLARQVQDAHTKLGGSVAIAAITSFDFVEFQSLKQRFESSDASKVSALVSELNETKTRVEQTEETLRRAAAERGIGAEASFFEAAAKDYKTKAGKWAFWTIVMTGFVIGYGLLTFYLPTILGIELADIPSAIQFTASKLIILFALTYFLFVCARNFQANRHNQIVNEHRKNALATYRTLVEAGESAELQNIVLHHAAAAIYQLHDTGLLRSQQNQNSSTNEFVPRPTLPIRLLSEPSS